MIIGLQEIVTILLFPILLSFYWKRSIYDYIFSKGMVIVCPSADCETLNRALYLVKNSKNVFGNQTIQTICISGSHSIEDIHINKINLKIIGNGETVIEVSKSFVIENGSNVEINSIELSGMGLHVTGDAKIKIEYCKISNCRSSGVIVQRGGSLRIYDSSVNRCSGSGIVCGDKGSAVNVKNCRINHNQSSGIYTYFGGECNIYGDKNDIIKNEQSDLRARGVRTCIQIHGEVGLCRRIVEEKGTII
jgi:hypothetical protein